MKTHTQNIKEDKKDPVKWSQIHMS
jgi:hypothetical protein